MLTKLSKLLTIEALHVYTDDLLTVVPHKDKKGETRTATEQKEWKEAVDRIAFLSLTKQAIENRVKVIDEENTANSASVRNELEPLKKANTEAISVLNHLHTKLFWRMANEFCINDALLQSYISLGKPTPELLIQNSLSVISKEQKQAAIEAVEYHKLGVSDVLYNNKQFPKQTKDLLRAKITALDNASTELSNMREAGASNPANKDTNDPKEQDWILKKERSQWTLADWQKADPEALRELLMSMPEPELKQKYPVLVSASELGAFCRELTQMMFNVGGSFAPTNNNPTWTLRDWESKDPKGLMQMIRTDVKSYQTLFEKEHGFMPSEKEITQLINKQ